MSHHLFDIESPFQDTNMAYWPYANHHSPGCNCEAMVQYSAEQRRRREWDEAVAAERQRQVEKGYDRAHDDEHGIAHLLTWAAEYARRGEHVKADALRQAALELVTTEPTGPELGQVEMGPLSCPGCDLGEPPHTGLGSLCRPLSQTSVL